MFELCLDPQEAQRLVVSGPKPETRDQATVRLPNLPEIAPETDTTTERPAKPGEPDLSVAFAMIMYWSQHGGC